jgi:hypothetical protein
MRNHYTKKRIRSIPNKVNSKIYPYSNPIKPRQKVRAEQGIPLLADPSSGSVDEI